MEKNIMKRLLVLLYGLSQSYVCMGAVDSEMKTAMWTSFYGRSDGNGNGKGVVYVLRGKIDPFYPSSYVYQYYDRADENGRTIRGGLEEKFTSGVRLNRDTRKFSRVYRRPAGDELVFDVFCYDSVNCERLERIAIEQRFNV